MYLSSLFISNFRSIKKLHLQFNKGKNVIVGRNNAGKSNIIKAIDLILGESSPTYDKSDKLSECDFLNGDLSNQIVIWAILSRDPDESLDYDALYKCFGFKIQSRIVGWDEYPGGKKHPIWEAAREKIGGSDFDEVLQKLIRISEREENGQSEYINPKLRNQQTYEQQFDDKYQFSLLFTAKADENGKIVRNIKLLYREDQSHDWVLAYTAHVRTELIQSAVIQSFRDPQNQLRISNWSWYGKLLKQYIDPENAALRAAFDQVKSASNEVFSQLQDKINNGRTKVAFPNTKISFQFNPDTKQDVHKSALIYVDDGYMSQLQEKGSGIQSATIIGLFHFYTKEIAHSGSSLIAIEEPELYLHPHGRRVISDRLTDFLDNGKNQVIITTHAAEFINSAQEDVNIVVVKKDRENGTLAKNASFKTAKEKQILIKSQNTEMFFADMVILVEGCGDKYILEAAAERYGSEHSILGSKWLNDNNISIIPVTGKTEFWKYALKLNEVNIRFRIMADFDFFTSGLAAYLQNMGLTTVSDPHNSINGKVCSTGPIKKLEQVRAEYKEDTLRFIEMLKSYNIFLLQGELEDNYSVLAKSTIEGLSGKEERTLHIVSKTFEEGNSIDHYIDLQEFYAMFDNLVSSMNLAAESEESEEIPILVAPVTSPSEVDEDDIPF